jgi:hypothetical protein
MVTFYGHVFGVGFTAPQNGKDFGPDGPQPANTIFPAGDANLGLGQFDWCSDEGGAQGLPPSPNSNTCDVDPNNKLVLFSTAGPVQVHSRDDMAYSKLHNEHGHTKDIVLDTTQDITATLWMSLDYHSWPTGNLLPVGDNGGTDCIVPLTPDLGCPAPYWGWDPAIYPQWVVEAKLYMADLGDYGNGASEPPPIEGAWSGGKATLVAAGATPPTDVTNGLPGSPNVLEYKVNLGKPKVDVIPKTYDFFLVYSFYSVLGGQKVGAHTWRVWAGELFPPTFTLPVKNAFDVELVIPQFVHDKLLVLGVMSTPWGSYDIDLGSAQLQVLDSGNAPVSLQHATRFGDYQVSHGSHFKPVNFTWVWDYQKDHLKPGAYKVLVTACNHQHSACETTQAGFTVDQNLQPTAIEVGRQGQRTITEGQLAAIQDQPGSPGNLTLAAAPVAALPARQAPGFDAFLIAPALAAAMLLLRRRWE